jgi:hypothetical protein
MYRRVPVVLKGQVRGKVLWRPKVKIPTDRRIRGT